MTMRHNIFSRGTKWKGSFL